jgi:hypothetical protein
MALTPGISHVIISVTDILQPVVKSFKIDNGKVTPEAIELII